MRYLEGSAPGGVTAPARLRAGRQRGFAPMEVHLAGNSLIQVFQARCTSTYLRKRRQGALTYCMGPWASFAQAHHH